MRNMKNIYKYFAIICGLIMGMFLFGANKTEAYVFYYDSTNAVGSSYNSNGYITDVKDQIVIYGQDVNAGYTVAYSSSKQIRIKNITMKVGNSNAVNITNYSISNVGANTAISGSYAITNTGSRSNTDKITINLQSILDSSFSGYSSSKDITITISLEKKGFCFIGCSWDDYTSISYKNSSGSATSQVTLNKTNASFLASQLASKSTGELEYPDAKVVNGEIYYNRGATKSSYYYLVKTNFKLKSGSAKANYTNAEGTSLSSTAVSFTVYSSYSQAKITNAKFSNMFVNDVLTKYNFYSFYVSATDLYGISATKTIDNSDTSLTIATITPKIDDIELSSDVSESYGAIQVNTKLDMGSMDYTNNSYTYTLTSVTFNVGSKAVTKSCTNCSGSVLSSTKSIQKTFTIYSNESTGAITFKNVVATITDKYGNSKSYSASTALTSSVAGTITLKSNADGAEFASTYTHYYDNDIMNFTITLKGLKNTTVSSIALIDDEDQTFVIYNSVITKDVDGLKVFTLQSQTIDFDNEKTWVGVKLIDVCNAGTCEDAVIGAVTYFNQYKALTIDDTITNDTTFEITGVEGNSVSVTSSKITITNAGNANIRLSGSCNYVSGDTPYVSCGYTNSSGDGSATVAIDKGAIVLGTGQRNDAMSFKIVENKSVPSATLSNITGEQVYYSSSNKTYYYKGTQSITVTLNDGYCGNGKFYYKFGDGDYEFIEFGCGTSNILSNSQLVVPLPGEDATYELKYYISSDGINQSAITHTDKYVSRNELVLDQAVINVNGDPFLANKADDYFSRVAIGVDNVTTNSLLTKYRMQFNEDLSYTEASLSEGNNSFLYDEASRLDLVDLNGEKISFTITLFDRLGNSKEYKYTVNIDTLTPPNPDPRATTSGENYVVTISNYAEYTEGDIITIAYDTDKEATCTKGVDATCSFTITHEVYALKATDRAGNESATTRYTTVETNASVQGDYLQIYPFLADVYDVRDDVTIRVVTYAYTEGTISNPNTVNRVCTSVTTVSCYTNYYLTSSSMYELIDTELNVKIGSLKLKTNATYFFLVTLGNSSQYLVDTSGAYPRKNIEYADVVGPELIVNSITTNPLLVSDSPVSTNTFTFRFSVSDANLTDAAKFEYLIINKTHVSNYTLSSTKFSEYLNYCPRNWSSYLSICGQWSTDLVSYSSIDGDTAQGLITISKNGTMLNNTTYILFIKAYDASGNFSIITLNEFVNISRAIDVYYKDGDAGAKTLAVDNTIKTVNANANIIVEAKSSLLRPVDISSVKLNGNSIGNTYRVGKGIHTLEVSDTLGNVDVITIYCGALSKPDITIYNYYDGVYYEISSDASYAYNSSTLDYLYVKVSGTNIQDISVNDGTDTLYDSDDNIFKYLTNADNMHEYGMKLSDLITNTSGTVTISATGDGGEITTINLNVDNQVPVIQILSGLATADIYLFDNPYTITLQTGTRNYNLEEANYKYELNYAYFFATARINLIVDGVTFDVIKESSNLIVKLDGVRVTNYDSPIATKSSGSQISIEYFDDAGNIAEPLFINLKIVDKEAPVFVDLDAERSVETNEEVALLDEKTTVSDNYNSPEDINIKAYVNGTIMFDGKYSNFRTVTYNFTQSVQYTVTFVLSDTNGNVSSVFTQKVNPSDTRGPVLADTFTLTGMELGKTKVIDLPRLIDTDAANTVYYPTIVEFYIGDVLVDSSHYTYSFDTDTLSVKFADIATTGDYIILLKAVDAAGNTTTVTTNFVLTDTTPPVINVYVNGVLITGDRATLVFGDPNYSISYEAIDAHDGKLAVTKTGDNVNVNKQGSYEYTLKARDKSNIQTVRIFTIVVEADDIAPVINKVNIGKVTLMPSNQSLTLYTSVNYEYEYIKVDASDNAALGNITINFDGNIITNNSQVRLIDGKSFTIIVEVKDTSGNSASATYYVSVDNSAPKINGIENYRVYDSALHATVSDPNLMQVNLYKDDVLVEEFTPANRTNPFVADLTEIGQYRIVATDTFKNEAVFVFEIKESLTNSIMGGDGNTTSMSTDTTYLTKVTLGNAGSIVINVTKNDNIGKKDQVYVIVADPNSDNMYVAYSTNGAYYNSQNTIVVNGNIITGTSNTDTLETIGENYYAYLMVIKSNEPDPSDKDSKGGMSESLKSTLIFLGLAVLAAGIVVLIIKIRRKVRAA